MSNQLELIGKCIDIYDLAIPLVEKLKLACDYFFSEVKLEYLGIANFDQFSDDKISFIYEKGNKVINNYHKDLFHRILISGELHIEEEIYYFPVKDVFFIYGILIVKPFSELNENQIKFFSIFSRFLSLFFKKEKLELSIKERLRNFSEITKKYSKSTIYPGFSSFLVNAKEFILKIFSVSERIKIIKLFFLYLAYEFKIEKAVFFIKNKDFNPLYGYNKEELNFVSLADAFKNYNKISFNKLHFTKKVKSLKGLKISQYYNPFCDVNLFNKLKVLDFKKLSFFPVFLKNNYIGVVITDEIKDINTFFRISLICEILAGALNFSKKINSLRTMYNKLKFSDHASLLELLGEISHEIKNPVMTIRGFANRLLKNFNELDISKVEKYLKIIADESGRLEKLLSDILIFSKATKVSLVTINLIDVLKECINILEDNLEERNIKLIFEYSVKPKITGNKSLLKQVFLNILNNSLEAIKQNGKIFIRINKKDKFCEVIFEDTGGGIPEEIINRIFEPFFTTKEFGTGLGLTITYKIMQIHGGTIKVENTLEGAKFQLVFPCRG